MASDADNEKSAREEFIQWFCSLSEEEQDQVEAVVKAVSEGARQNGSVT